MVFHQENPKAAKAVVLLSGGLDSATILAIARQHYDCYALSIDYGQKHKAELHAASHMAQIMHVSKHVVMHMPMQALLHSALTDVNIQVPTSSHHSHDATALQTIPSTYVPARNTLMLSMALAWAESLGAYDIFYGANAVDYSGYPDCRPAYVQAFNQLIQLATKTGVEGKTITIHAPIIDMRKAQIIQMGMTLGVDYALTVSCYQADTNGQACGSCDACHLRREGFMQAGVKDPTRYRDHEHQPQA